MPCASISCLTCEGKKAQKQKVEQSLSTAQSENKPLHTDISNSDNMDNLESMT